MRLLSVDAGLNLGWAVIDSANRPVCGSKKLPWKPKTKPLGHCMYVALDFLTAIGAKHKVDAVVYAMPFIHRKATPAALLPLFSLMGTVEQAAHELDVPCHSLSEQDARKSFLGGIPRGTDAIKAAVLAGCKQRGWPVCDHHAADAVCVGVFAMSLLDPTSAHLTTPLFIRKRRR